MLYRRYTDCYQQPLAGNSSLSLISEFIYDRFSARFVDYLGVEKGIQTTSFGNSRAMFEFRYRPSITGTAMYDACWPERNTRWVARWKSDSCARKMFGTKRWGLRSITGNQELCA
jgi:hypothetical protein